MNVIGTHVASGSWWSAVTVSTLCTLQWRYVTRRLVKHRSLSGLMTHRSMPSVRVPAPYRSSRISRNRNHSSQILVPKVGTLYNRFVEIENSPILVKFIPG